MPVLGPLAKTGLLIAMRKKKSLVLSTKHKECALDCLRMLLIDYSGDTNYVYLSMPEKPPYSLKDIIRLAKRQGLKAEGYRCLDKKELKDNESFPLCLVIKEGEDTHMVILDRITKGMAYLRDPAAGHKKMPLDALIERWTGEYLLIGPFEGSFYSGPLPDKISSDGRYVAMGLSLLSQLCVWAGFYLISVHEGLVLPLICFCLFALLELSVRLYSVRLGRKFDEKYLYRLEEASEEDIAEGYSYYQRFKSAYFAMPLSLFANLFGGLSLSVLFIINDMSFLLPYSLLLLALFFDAAFLEGRLAKKSMALEEKEKGLYGLPRGSERGFYLIALSQEGNSLGNLIVYRKLLFIFLEGVLALLATLIGGPISLNRFLLFFMAEHAISMSLGSALSILLRYQEIKAGEIGFRRAYLLGRPNPPAL